MKIFNIILIVFLIVVISFTSFVFLKPQKNNESFNDNSILNLPDFVYYYREDCPYCKEVEKFFKENDIENKISLVKKEITSKDNLEEFKKIVEVCKLNLDEVGVPFMWIKGECLMGYDKIVEYFKDYLKKIEIENSLNKNQEINFYSFDEVSKHKDSLSCWSVINNEIYDFTSWLNNHPGGKEAILNLCGKDGTTAFLKKHKNQEKPLAALKQFKIGVLKND